MYFGKVWFGDKGFSNPASQNQSLFVFYSDDEERSSLFGSSEVDGTEVDGADKPSDSRIRNL